MNITKTHIIIAIVAVVLIALYLSRNKIRSFMTRGYINKNPGNIRPDGKQWVGEVPKSTDKEFKQFTSMPYGYRAMFVNLKGYFARGLNTIEQIISAWAPSKDGNNTKAYIAFVSKKTGIPSDKVLSFDTATARKLVAAISQQENGIPANMDDVDAGYRLL